MTDGDMRHQSARDRGGPSAGRLFFGIPLAEPVRARLSSHLADALQGERLPGRAVAAPNWHLTLRFLGDTGRDLHERIVRDLSRIDLGTAFDVRFDRLGAFPAPQRARVLWLGIAEGVEPLVKVAAAVESTVVGAGVEPDERPFAAHLTLSRLKPEQDLRSLIERVPPFPQRMRIDRVLLYRSHLEPGGPRYEVVNRFALTAPSGPSHDEGG